MSNLMIDVDSVVSSGSRVLTAAESAASPPAAMLTPAGADPVSVGVATALEGRAAGLAAYSAAGSAITTAHGQLLMSSASVYADQEALNSSSLGGGGGGGAAGPVATPPAITLPVVPPASPPVLGAPPGSGRVIAELLHAGPGPSGLHSAAQQLRSHAEQLHHTADRVNDSAARVSSDWSSQAGMRAAHRLGELGTWFEQHARQVRSLAAAIDGHGESFSRVKATVPTPEQFRDVENRLAAAAAANANPVNMGRYAPVVAALQAQLAQMNAQAQTAYSGYAAESSHPGMVGSALQPPPQPNGAGVSGATGPNIVNVGTPDPWAGPGSNVGPGVPPSIVGGSGATVKRPVYTNPGGAMGGPSTAGLGVAPVSSEEGASGSGYGPVPHSIVGPHKAIETPVYMNPGGAMGGPSTAGLGVAPVSSEGASGSGYGPVPPSIVGPHKAIETPVYMNPGGAMGGPSTAGLGVAPVSSEEGASGSGYGPVPHSIVGPHKAIETPVYIDPSGAMPGSTGNGRAPV